MATRDGMYKLMAKSTSALPPQAQQRILTWALGGKEEAVLCDLARRDDLTATLEAELLKVRKSSVVAAWMSVPERARRFAETLVNDQANKESRIGVLAELAKCPKLPSAVYQRCADRDHYTVAMALLANPDVTGPVRETAAVSVLQAPSSMQTTAAYRQQVTTMLLRDPQLFDAATAQATSVHALAAALLTPGMAVTHHAAGRFVDAFALALSDAATDVKAAAATGKAQGTIRRKVRNLVDVLGEITIRQALPVVEANRLGDAVLAGVEQLREAQQKRDSFRWSLNVLERRAQDLRLQTQTKACQFARLLQTTDRSEWVREVAASTAGMNYRDRVTAAVWSSVLTVDMLIEAPLGSIRLRDMDDLVRKEACIYHLEAGRRDVAIALIVLRDFPYDTETIDMLCDHGVGHEEVVAAGIELNAKAKEAYYTSRWAQEASVLPVDVLGGLPAKALINMSDAPAIADMVTERLTEEFGDDDALWGAFDMLASRELHGTFDELIATVRNLVTMKS